VPFEGRIRLIFNAKENIKKNRTEGEHYLFVLHYGMDEDSSVVMNCISCLRDPCVQSGYR